MSESQPKSFPEHLAPMKAGPFIIGYVPDIHGPDGQLKPVEISKAEARVLVWYYLEECERVQQLFNLGCSGSREIRWKPYCIDRINKLVDSGILSEEEVGKIKDEFHGQRKAEAIRRVEEAAIQGQYYLARKNGKVWALFELGSEDKIQLTMSVFGHDDTWRSGLATELIESSEVDSSGAVRIYPPAHL